MKKTIKMTPAPQNDQSDVELVEHSFGDLIREHGEQSESELMIKPAIIFEEQDDEPDDVYEGTAREVIQDAIMLVADTLDDAADLLKQDTFDASDDDVHLGLAGSMIQCAREAKARDLTLIGCNVELAYMDEKHNIHTFNKILRNHSYLESIHG